jgi:hypothetical protein
VQQNFIEHNFYQVFSTTITCFYLVNEMKQLLKNNLHLFYLYQIFISLQCSYYQILYDVHLNVFVTINVHNVFFYYYLLLLLYLFHNYDGI